jgi:hypothetical protein
MPVVIEHTPAREIGNLAERQGAFNTAMALNENNRAWSADNRAWAAQSGQQAYQNASLAQRQQELDQQSADRQAGFDNQQTLQAMRGMAQQDLEHLRHADTMEKLADQFERQGANADHVQAMRDAAAAERQQASLGARNAWHDQTDATRRYGIDTNQDLRTRALDQGDQRIKLLQDRAASLVSSRDPQAALQWKMQLQAMRQADRNFNLQLHAQEMKIKGLYRQYAALSRNASGAFGENQRALMAQAKAIGDQITREEANYSNSILRHSANGMPDGSAAPSHLPGYDGTDTGEMLNPPLRFGDSTPSVPVPPPDQWGYQPGASDNAGDVSMMDGGGGMGDVAGNFGEQMPDPIARAHELAAHFTQNLGVTDPDQLKQAIHAQLVNEGFDPGALA